MKRTGKVQTHVKYVLNMNNTKSLFGRPIPLVEKCILGLQDAMNDVGEFAREKYNMLVSFEASQKTRADFQASQLVMLQNELLAAEAEGVQTRILFFLHNHISYYFFCTQWQVLKKNLV